jgi:alkylation response protein AidB-like acyl-CoA dehydrogenase
MIDELFTAELLPTLRRLGERPLGTDEVDPAETAARADVWRVLCDLGVPALTGPDLLDVAGTLGRALYRCPLLETATAAELIAAGGDPLALLPALTAGTATAVAVTDLDFVPYAADADWLVVGDDLVPRDRTRRRRRDDITRGDLYAVTVTGPPAAALRLTAEARTAATTGARLRQAAYLCGMARGALDLTVDYTRRRRQFGQPVSRFQAPAFRLAALYARIEAVAALIARAQVAADATRALLLAADLARDAGAEAIQLHGAYGMTERADAQLFYRHAALEAIRLGTPTALRAELADVLL